MKKIILFMTLMASFTATYSQTASELPNFRKNDLVIDPFWLIGGLALNASYERIISADAGVGVNAILGIGNDLDDFSQISPYYRAYFGSKYASGFYIEGFVPITMQKENLWDNNGNETNRTKTYTTGGLGFGLGGKWVAKKKFVFELNLGIGRQFIGDHGSDDPVTGKGMIGVGYAF